MTVPQKNTPCAAIGGAQGHNEAPAAAVANLVTTPRQAPATGGVPSLVSNDNNGLSLVAALATPVNHGWDNTNDQWLPPRYGQGPPLTAPPAPRIPRTRPYGTFESPVSPSPVGAGGRATAILLIPSTANGQEDAQAPAGQTQAAPVNVNGVANGGPRRHTLGGAL